MKYSELSNFTYDELSHLTWEQIALDTEELINRIDNGNIVVPDSIKNKLLNLIDAVCEQPLPEANIEAISKIKGEKTFSISAVLQSISHIITISEKLSGKSFNALISDIINELKIFADTFIN